MTREMQWEEVSGIFMPKTCISLNPLNVILRLQKNWGLHKNGAVPITGWVELGIRPSSIPLYRLQQDADTSPDPMQPLERYNQIVEAARQLCRLRWRYQYLAHLPVWLKGLQRSFQLDEESIQQRRIQLLTEAQYKRDGDPQYKTRPETDE